MTPELKSAIVQARAEVEAELELSVQDGWVCLPVHDLRLILAALAEREWREMETAPTNGQSVLLFCPRARDYGYARIRLTWRKDGLWQGANNTLWPPTHWMPLPPPPQEGGE